MLEMRPVCENCRKPLPNDSNDAMICTYECTFCKDCVKNHPVSTKEIYKQIDKEKFKRIYDEFVHLDPRKR